MLGSFHSFVKAPPRSAKNIRFVLLSNLQSSQMNTLHFLGINMIPNRAERLHLFFALELSNLEPKE